MSFTNPSYGFASAYEACVIHPTRRLSETRQTILARPTTMIPEVQVAGVSPIDPSGSCCVAGVALVAASVRARTQ